MKRWLIAGGILVLIIGGVVVWTSNSDQPPPELIPDEVEAIRVTSEYGQKKDISEGSEAVSACFQTETCL